MKKMNFKSFWLMGVLTVMFSLLILSCSNEGDVNLSPEIELEDGSVLINDDATLSSFVNLSNEVVRFEDPSGLKSASVEDEYTLTLVASIEDGNKSKSKQSATFVEILDDMAVVTFHTQAGQEKGGFWVINMKNPASPVLTSSYLDGHTDFNACRLDDADVTLPEIGDVRRMWLAADVKQNGASVIEVYLQDEDVYYPGKKKDKENNGSKVYQKERVLDAASTNGITRVGDFLYVAVGGENGGTWKLNADDLSTVGKSLFPYNKFTAYCEDLDLVVALQATEDAKLHIYPGGDLDAVESIDLGEYYYPGNDENPGDSDNHQAADWTGKSTIWVEGTKVFVSMGARGLKVIDLSSADKSEVVYQYTMTEANTGNINGVTMFDDYLFIAAGADGLILAKLPDVGTEIEVLGVYDSEGSVNYVSSTEDYILIASGLGHVKVLTK